MKLRGLRTLRRAAHWSRCRFQVRALVLAYHRVADGDWDPYSLCVSRQNFGEQLDVLSGVAHPDSLMNLVSALQRGSLPERRVALTFDDGYADNLHEALPLLERFDIPATVFVTTGFLGQEFWWDRLARRIGKTSEIRDDLDVAIGENRFEWRRPAEISEASRRKLLYSMGAFMRKLCRREQGEILDRLDDWLRPSEDGHPEARSMTTGEVLELANSGGVDIGSHTVTHPLLERLSAEQQREEISRSKAHLEEVTGRLVRTFAYPNGSYSAATPAIARDLGLSCACASTESAVISRSDPYLMPRLWVPNVGGERFRRWLGWWLG